MIDAIVKALSLAAIVAVLAGCTSDTKVVLLRHDYLSRCAAGTRAVTSSMEWVVPHADVERFQALNNGLDSDAVRKLIHRAALVTCSDGSIVVSM